MTSALQETLEVTCSAFPLQIEGPIDGAYVYFRARNGGWQIGIGRNQDEAIDATFVPPPTTAAVYGQDECERMSQGDRAAAWDLIEQYLPRLRLETTQ